MTFAAGVLTGVILGISYWSFITKTKGLVGDDDTNEYGRVEARD